jgi:hypothetical protein
MQCLRLKNPRSGRRFNNVLQYSFLPCYRGGKFAAREQEGLVFQLCDLGPLLSAAQTVLPGSRGGMAIVLGPFLPPQAVEDV